MGYRSSSCRTPGQLQLYSFQETTARARPATPLFGRLVVYYKTPIRRALWEMMDVPFKPSSHFLGACGLWLDTHYGQALGVYNLEYTGHSWQGVKP